MKKACLVLLLGVLMGLVYSTDGTAAEKRVALVIGNGNYAESPLKNPVNDAEDMAAALQSLGFTVVKKTNADKRVMIAAMDEFYNLLRTSDVGLFFYAGHGIQVDGRNYLIPVDAKVQTETDVEFESVDAGRLLGKMETAGNRTNIIILDACRNNPFARSFRSQTRGLARMDAPKGSYVAFSTAPGSTAADGTGRNGLFTENLLKNIRTPSLKIEDVMKLTRAAVASATSDQQMAWDSSSLLGDFFFVPGSGAVAVVPGPAAVSSAAPTSASTQTAAIQPDTLDRKTLAGDISGAWRIAAATFYRNSFPIPNGDVLDIQQKGETIRFTASAWYHYWGEKYRTETFQGTMKNGYFFAECPYKKEDGGWTMKGLINNNGEIEGTMTCNRYSAPFTLFRYGKSFEINKYTNNQPQQPQGGCFIQPAE